MPASFLHPKGTFLPAPEAAIINWQLQPSVPPSVVNSTTPAPEPSPSSSRAAAAREVLVAALGPELAATLPLAAIVLETDAPDIPPAWQVGARNTPDQLPRMAAELAALCNLPVADIIAATSRNARRVLSRLAN